MKNLHKIDVRPELPLWAKQLACAWYKASSKYNIWYLEYSLSANGIETIEKNSPRPDTIFYDSEETWRRRGWSKYMKVADLSLLNEVDIRIVS